MTDCRYTPPTSRLNLLNLRKWRILISVTDYIVQGSRYQILEEYGCAETAIASGVELMLQDLWFVGLPLIAVTLYLRESTFGQLLPLQLGTNRRLKREFFGISIINERR